MEVAVNVRRTPLGFDAWSPDIPGCAASGASETEAIHHLRHAIEGRLALEGLSNGSAGSETRRVHVDSPEEKRIQAERRASERPEPATPIPPYFQFAVGGSLFGVGLTGIFSFILVQPTTSPVVLFGSAILAALGAGGILMGLITLESSKTVAR